MKNAAVVAAIFTSLFTGTTTAATIYDNNDTNIELGGRAEPRFNLSKENKGDNNDDNEFKDKSRARLALKGESVINEQFAVFGKYEVEISDNNNSTVDTRYLYAGLDTAVGAISYGKQDSAQVMLTDYTDILSTFGGDAVDLVDGNKDKRENNFLYIGEFNNIAVATNYIAENNNNLKDSDSYGIAAQYQFPFGLNVGAGYVNGNDGANIDARQFNLAMSYQLNNIYAAATYANGKHGDADLSGYELAAAYTFDQFTARGVYNFQQSEQNNTTTDEVDYFALEGLYKFNKSLRTYIGYKFQQLDKKDDELQAGIRYDF
ncbi:porin [Photobacterium sp. NCIMB 13483]|uniref:porin n=1 Tax=Photobacterium sp. NCIMB 13483 TaxID=2022103 RepID=UPI000D153090|nr:porin [Photobacterium sp. NCIMB 13483]PST94990.1 porin [Photobacterium sp. NCIMB 13483]